MFFEDEEKKIPFDESERNNNSQDPQQGPLNDIRYSVNDLSLYDGTYPFSTTSLSEHPIPMYKQDKNQQCYSTSDFTSTGPTLLKMMNNSTSNDTQNFSFEPPPSYYDISQVNEIGNSEQNNNRIQQDNPNGIYSSMRYRQLNTGQSIRQQDEQYSVPAILPVDSFDALNDAKLIRKKLMKLFGSNPIKHFIELMSKRSQNQRREILRCLQHQFGIAIQNYIKQGNLNTLLIPLISSPADGDAFIIFQSVTIHPINFIALIDVLCTRTGNEISSLKTSYKLSTNINSHKSYKSLQERFRQNQDQKCSRGI